MNILYTAYYTVLRNIRDWKYIAMLIVAPLLTILVTGVATDSIDKTRMIEKIKVVYYSDDTGKVSKAFETFIEDKKVKDAFVFEKVASNENGLEKVKNAKVEAYIYLESNFTKKIEEGSSPSVKIFASKKNSGVKSLVESFTNIVNTQTTIQKISKSQVQEIQFKNNISETELSPTGVSPSGLDRWTYFNILLFIFYGAIVSSFAVINDMTKNTLTRINSTPIGIVSDVAGKILGNTFTFFMCSIIIVIFTKFAYGSNWDGNIGIILLILLIYCLFVTCLGIILGKLVKKMAVAVLLIISLNSLLFNLANLGDMKWGKNGDSATMLATISPHYYVAKALINNIFNGSKDSVYHSIISLGSITVIILIISLILGRRTVR